MPEEEFRTQLENEGFSDIRVRTDGPDTIYKIHTHPVTVAHIILSGHIRLVMDGEVHLLHPGDRLDVPAHVPHEAEIGGEGCTYMIGDKA
jgi:quercetin dioxygenase-like cupin family protein